MIKTEKVGVPWFLARERAFTTMKEARFGFGTTDPDGGRCSIRSLSTLRNIRGSTPIHVGTKCVDFSCRSRSKLCYGIDTQAPFVPISAEKHRHQHFHDFQHWVMPTPCSTTAAVEVLCANASDLVCIELSAQHYCVKGCLEMPTASQQRL